MKPEQYLAQLLEQSEQMETRCGDGVIAWQRWPGGSGRPLLLLHGGFGSWTHWARNIRELRKTRTLWTLDLPGLGKSEALPDSTTVVDFATAVQAGFDQLAGEQLEFDLAGFSFGALIGAQLAAEAGARCAHFIACGGAGFGDLHVQVDLLRPPTAATAPVDADAIHRANLHSLMLANPDAIDELAVYIHGQNLAQARYNSRRLAKGSGFIEALPGIEARLCGVWGERDATAGGAAAIAARETLFRQQQPDCEFHLLPGIGHWAMYEAVDAFNHIVDHTIDG